MRPFVIDDNLKSEMARIRKHAEANRIPLAEMKKRAEDPNITPVGDVEGFFSNLPFGFKVVFSIEEHPLKADPNKGVWLRHMSVSVPRKDAMPHPMVVETLGKLLGFAGLNGSAFYQETLPNFIAINVLAPLEETPPPADQKENGRVP